MGCHDCGEIHLLTFNRQFNMCTQYLTINTTSRLHTYFRFPLSLLLNNAKALQRLYTEKKRAGRFDQPSGLTYHVLRALSLFVRPYTTGAG